MVRPTGEEMCLLAHMARGRVGADEVSRVVAEPDRDRRLGVVDVQRRLYQMW